MEFHLNDFIKPNREDSVFIGKLYQIIEFQDKREFGKRARLVKIRNMNSKTDLTIDETMLFKHFEKIDFKSLDLTVKNQESTLTEVSKEEALGFLENQKESSPNSQTNPEGVKIREYDASNLSVPYKERALLGKSEIQIPEGAKEQIALIRKLIKEKCPTVSVRCGTGTAWGWVDIWGSADEFNSFSEAERKALTDLGLNCGGNCSNISPEDRKYYIRKWLSSKKEEI